jgi:hypothetical protein
LQKMAVQSKTFRNCCFLLPRVPTHSKEAIEQHIVALVEKLKLAKDQRCPDSIVLKTPPTYFLSKEGPGIWLALNSGSTKEKKWEKVGNFIGAVSVRVIPEKIGSKVNEHGLGNVGKFFNLAPDEVLELYCNRVQCKELPSVTDPFLGIHSSALKPSDTWLPLVQSKPHSVKRKCKHEIESGDEDEQPLRGKRARARGLDTEAADTPRKKSRKEGGEKESPPKMQQRFTMLRKDSSGKALAQAPPPAEVAISAKEVRAEEPFKRGRAHGDLTSFQTGIPMLCRRFILDAEANTNVAAFIGELSHQLGDAVNEHFSIFTENFPQTLLLRTLRLQTAIVQGLREGIYQIPVQNLTLNGIVKQNVAWNALYARDSQVHDKIIAALDDIIAALDKAFTDQGFALVDPVSNSFFLSVHVLFALQTKHDKNPVLYHSIKDMTQVHPIPPALCS